MSLLRVGASASRGAVPMKQITTSVPFDIGEPVSDTNPLPVSKDSTGFLVGEPISDTNPLPVGDAHYVLDGKGFGLGRRIQRAVIDFPGTTLIGEPISTRNPLPVKFVGDAGTPPPAILLPPTVQLEPFITGSLVEGQTLTTTNGTWARSPTSITRQWMRNGVAIAGATGLTYVLTAADVGTSISVLVTATNADGSTVAPSSSRGPIASLVLNPPANLVAPAISGTPKVSLTLTTTDGNWSNSPTSITRQWMRDGVAVAGQTGLTYDLSAADLGATIRCDVTATNADGTHTTQSNVLGPVIALAPPVNTVAPAVTGTAMAGQTLTTTNGTWSNSPTSFARQWMRGGVAIAGETGLTYALVTGDVGTTIRCDVTATNADGSTTTQSNTTAAIAAIPAPTPPVSVASPIIAGTTEVGQTLTATAGAWTNSPTSVTGQWKRNGVAITGQTGLTYLLASADLAAMIRYDEMATNADGSTAASSNVLGPITNPVAGTMATPTISFANTAGDAPIISTSSADFVEGMWVEWEFAAGSSPAVDSNGKFTTPTQHGVTLVDGGSWSLNDLALNFNNPSGTYSFHLRFLRDSDTGSVSVTDQQGQTFTVDASAWSNTISDTIITSVGAFATTTGVDKSTYVTVTNNADGTQTLQCAVNNGGLSCVRVFPAATGKRHIEMTIEDINAAVGIGVTDPGVALNTNMTGATPGSNTTTAQTGFMVKLFPSLTSLSFSRNGTAVSFNLPPAVAGGGLAVYQSGDKVILEIDVDTAFVKIWYYRIGTGVTTLLGSATLTTKIPTTWNVIGHCSKGDATHKDRVTFNFGKVAFISPPTSGYLVL